MSDDGVTGGPGGGGPAGEDAAASSPPEGAIRLEERRPSRLYVAISSRLARIERNLQAKGDRAARAIGRMVWALIAAVGVLLLIGPVINPPLGFDDIIGSAEDTAHSWIARSFTADYDLSRTDDGRLQVRVTEDIDAFFPDDVDQSTIERVVPSQYQTHDLSPTLVSASLDGQDVTVQRDAGATRTTFRIDHGRRLSGDHRVRLVYTLHDLAFSTRNASSDIDEDLLEWNAFGPDFPHGVAQTTVRISMPRSLSDAFARHPHGGLQWLLLSDSEQLDAHGDGDRVRFEITNEQNIPPYAVVWFRFPFQDGTFAMPAPSPVFWLQVLGPVVPLALLALVLLAALAARASLWRDASGRAWYVYQSEPQRGVPATVASRVMRRMRTAPLVADLEAYRQAHGAAKARRRLVRTADRTGRLGHLPIAAGRYVGASAWKQTFDDGLRTVPRGFVRDMLIGAALSLTVLQWGLVRQVSQQVPIADFWWPRTVVIVSTVVALVTVAIVLSVRPLTRAGAEVKEHLLGLRLFLEQTTAFSRTRLNDPLLPYILLFARPRQARRLIGSLLEREGIRAKADDDPDFLSAGRLWVRAAAVAAVAAAIAVVVWVPSGNLTAPDDAAYDSDTPGVTGFDVSDFSAGAVLSRNEGMLRLDVHEKIEAVVQAGRRQVPQVVRQWRDEIDGHRAELTVRSVTVDGEPVRFEQSRRQHMAMLTTRIAEDWDGRHEVVIHYTVDDPLSYVLVDGQWQQQLRWVALNRGWDFAWSPPDHDAPRSVAVSLTVPAGVIEKTVGAAGWFDDGRWPDPGVRALGSGTTADDGAVRFAEHYETDADGRWPLGDADNGFYSVHRASLGAQLRFPSDTFAATATPVGAVSAALVRAAPAIVPATLGAGAVVFALIGIIRMRGSGRLRGIHRDVAVWLPVGFTLAQFVTLFWATGDVSSDDPILLLVFGALAVSLAGVITVLVSDHRRKETAAKE